VKSQEVSGFVKMETQYYINLFKALIRHLENNGFEGALAFNTALVFLQELNKDRRSEEIRAERAKEKEMPATEKQMTFLKDLGHDIEHSLTKQKAGMMIQEILAHRENGR
jgi:hypothetical protein